MKSFAFHRGIGPAFKMGPKAHGPVGGLGAAAPPLPTNPAVAAPTPPPAGAPSPSAGGGGGLQALMADAKQAAGG